MCVGASVAKTDTTDDTTQTVRKFLLSTVTILLGTARPRESERTVTLMVAAESVNKCCLTLEARHMGARDEYVDQGMLNYMDPLGLAKAHLKYDQEPSALEAAHVHASRCKTTLLAESANPRVHKGAWAEENEPNQRYKDNSGRHENK